jgi:kynurenine formamidase
MNSTCRLFAVTFLLIQACTLARAQAQEAWYPSKYGPDDTIGAANNLSPNIVLKAAQLVTKGKVYSLAIVTGPATPGNAIDGSPRDYKVFVAKREGPPDSLNKLTLHDDMVIGWNGIGTQIDGLGHAGIDGRYYNGNPANQFYTIGGLKKLGVQGIPPIVTRGILLDMAKYYGVDMVPAGTAFNRAELMGAMKKQGIEVRKGDVVLLYTGWINLLPNQPEKYWASEPGLGKDGALYLAEQGIVAVGSDTKGVEVIPFEVKGEFGPVHQIMIAKNGIHLLEYIDSRQLAADGVHEFLFVVGVPRIQGAAQAIIHPIAIR